MITEAPQEDFKDAVDDVAHKARQGGSWRISPTIPNLGIGGATQHPSARALGRFPETGVAPGFWQIGPAPVRVSDTNGKVFLGSRQMTASMTC